MAQQEQFEADYLAAFPFVYPADIRQMEECSSAGFVRTKTLWLQQAKRHEAEKAELVAALKVNHQHHTDYDDHDGYKCSTLYDMNVAFIEKYEVKKS